jgi:GMP synthase (glutamine-hydrolysing)
VRVLAFRHVPFEGLGLIEPTLESRGIAFHYADLNQHGAPLPDTSRYDGLIFLGGPMSANDALPYLRTEPGAIEPAVATGKPVLGVCLGAQLIARALGARVYCNVEREIGWFEIQLAQGAACGPAFTGLGRSETVFHWHSDTFELPAGAVEPD